MRTDELLAALARGPIAVRSGAVGRFLGMALAAGVAIATAAMLAWLGLRADLPQALATPMFWLKFAYPAVLTAAGFAAVARLARPSGRARVAARAASTMGCGMVVAGAIAVLIAPSAVREPLIFGRSALACLIAVTALAVPSLVALFVALRALAPTRPSAAGAAAGLLAGGAAAAVYAWHCDESSLPFLAFWYTLAIAGPVIIGAAFGRRWLHWA
jgi:hypothetical protein